MDGETGGLPGSVQPESRLNVFALVIYIPGLLGEFLDDLRRELTPGCNPRAHVSLLPPRPLDVPWQTACSGARAALEARAPFDVHLTEVRTFPGTNVIYLNVDAGAGELRGLHGSIGRGALSFEEPFPYCPHVTLAQEFPLERVGDLEAIARRRWQEYTGERKFRASHAVFVQNTVANRWIDLAEYDLGALAAKL